MVRFLAIGALSSLAGLGALGQVSSAQENAGDSHLQVSVVVVNSAPIPGEPLKVRVTLENTGSTPLEVPGVIDKASIRFVWSSEGKRDGSASPADDLSTRGSKPRMLAPRDSIVTSEMITSTWDSNPRFPEPGDYLLAVSFKGKRSNPAKLTMGTPRGVDKGALEHLQKSKLLQFLTLYGDAPMKEESIRDLRSCLDLYPGSRFSPWVRVALASYEVHKCVAGAKKFTADSTQFSTVLEMLASASETEGFPFSSELQARMGWLYVNAGLEDIGKDLLLKAMQKNDISDIMRVDIQGATRKSSASSK